MKVSAPKFYKKSNYSKKCGVTYKSNADSHNHRAVPQPRGNLFVVIRNAVVEASIRCVVCRDCLICKIEGSWNFLINVFIEW